MQMNNPKPGKEDTPMRPSEALSYEPAACWRRLLARKHEFFFEDLDQLMKERHRQFLEQLMGYEPGQPNSGALWVAETPSWLKCGP